MSAKEIQQLRFRNLESLRAPLGLDEGCLLPDPAAGESVPRFALVERGPYSDWLTFTATIGAALDYIAADDSDFEGRQIVDLQSGQVELVGFEPQLAGTAL